jgi:hypothetical protein
MAKGDHLVVWRFGYEHHGIDCGNGAVVEYQGGIGHTGPVRVVSRAEFANGACVRIIQHPTAFPPNEVVRRAEGRIGEDEYDLLTNNCEHFAYWATTGESKSGQVGSSVTTSAAAALRRGMKSLAKSSGKQPASLVSGLLLKGISKTLDRSK